MSRIDKTENPFIENLYDIKTRTKNIIAKKGQVVDTVDRETGEIQSKYYDALVFPKVVDPTSFVKLYPSSYDVFKTLSKPATMMLWYFLSNLGYGDTVALNVAKAKEFTGYSSDKSIYNAISELKKADVIANHYRNSIYFVNPILFYRGQRMKLLGLDNAQ